MAVGSICVRGVDSARPDESVGTAAERMHQRAVGTLVVVNSLNEVVGIVTDRDLVSRVLAKRRMPEETPVEDVMTLRPQTVDEFASVEKALKLMRRGRFRRLPIVDHDNKLVGLLCLDDVLMSVSKEMSQIGQILRRETPRAVVEDPDSDLSSVRRFQCENRIGKGG